MRLVCWIAVIACVLASSLFAQQPRKPADILADMKKREKQIAASEKKKGWTKINWAESPTAAIEKAKKESKPLLLVLVVGEKGAAKAERC